MTSDTSATTPIVVTKMPSTGWPTFSNLIDREASAFWRTRAWWWLALANVLLVNGLTGLATLGLARSGALARGDLASDELAQLFFVFHLIFAAGSAIVTAQSAVLGDEQDGSAAWILSKPVSRSTYLLAKALNLAVNAVVVGVLVPVAVIVPLWLWLGFAPSVATLVSIVGGLALLVTFFSTLTLMLGTLLPSRAAVVGTALVVLVAMIQLGQIFPHALPGGIPFTLATLLRDGQGVSATPFVVTLALIAACLGVAVWRFRRTEF